MASSIAAITTGTGGIQQTADASGNLNLVSGTTTIVAMTSAGIAVTGTLSSTGITTVAAGSAALPAIVSTTGTADTGLWFPAADTVAASTAGAERMRIDSSGNVGIGTSSPGQKLEVYVTANSLQIESVVRNDQAGTGVAAIGFNVSSSAAAETSSTKAGIGLVRSNAYGVGSLCFYNNATSSAGNFTTADERMRIDTSGTVQISAGTSTPTTVVETSGFMGDGIYAKPVYVNTSLTSSKYMARFFNGNGNVGNITTSGSATTYATSSDYRLKNTIAQMTGALDTVALLNPVTFKWNVDGLSSQGFIAHELQAIVPDCVTGEKDAVDAEGKPKYQGIDTSFLVATLTAAIQELKGIIDTQAAQITALNAKVGI